MVEAQRRLVDAVVAGVTRIPMTFLFTQLHTDGCSMNLHNYEAN